MSLIRDTYNGAARVLGVLFLGLALSVNALSQAVSTTNVQGTVYLANGAPGSGTLQITWPAFTTAANQAVAAGRLTANIGANGSVSVNLAPNLGSSPAGLFYTAVYHLSDGTTSTEYWVVPAATQASIAQVRSQVMPAAQAVQAVSKAYVDQAIESLAQGNLNSTGGQLTGPLYLTGDPTQSLQAADKHYVDATFAQALPLTGGAATGPLTATQLGGAYQVDQFAGSDFGAKLQACLATVNSTYGGTCDARNFSGNLSMAANLTIATANTTVLLPCATINTANQIIITAGTRNVSLRGCALRGASNGSGSQGGTVLLYSGPGVAIQIGDRTYAADTLGFHLDDVVINTTGSNNSSTQAIAAFRTQEMDLESLYLLGNGNQTGITLDGTGNYTGGTFYDNHISGFQTAINGIGHQVTNSAATDWLNAGTFVRLHIDCPTNNGSPISGTYGVNLQQGDGNSFTGGDVENCATALHLGANAQNNTIVGLRNENSTYQVVADAGSSYNSWMTGGTMFTGRLSDNGTRNSFLDTFHRSFNSLNGDWYGSQQDSTLTNHFRLGIGSGSERGLLNRYQTDYGYRWTMGLSDATGGEQFYQVLDELNSVYRISIGQYNNGQASTNNQTVINSAGTGAVVLNGSNNSGTGGVVFGSGGPSGTTVATVSNTGSAQFNGTLQVGGTTQSTGTMTVRNNADAEVDYYLWPGLTTNQKGSFTYKDFNGNSQWYMVKDASNNWALNSAVGNLDSFKAYQSTNSGDTYINASNSSGIVRVNYETGAGSTFSIYGGSSSNLYASFSGTNSIKFPGLAASSGRNCLQIDSSGYISNTGTACGSGSGGSGTVNSGSTGQIAYYSGNGAAVSGMSTIPVSAGGTGAATAGAALASLGGASLAATATQNFSGPLNASVNSQINVMAPPYNAVGNGTTHDDAAINAACDAAKLKSPALTVYFPRPPNFYLADTLTHCTGVTFHGQAPGLGIATGGGAVTIQGLPGKDILHGQDFNTAITGTAQGGNWDISDIQFRLDDSVDASAGFPHRWPGRWTDDGQMTAGSTTLWSPKQRYTCSDVGSAITVKGAGSSGDLVTTIAGMPSCSDYQSSITLAAPAITTVTNALVYTAPPGLSTTDTLGNCAIGEDNFDGNSAHWVQAGGNLYPTMHNVSFVTTSGATKNHSCAIYFQSQWIPYGIQADHVNIQRFVFGVVEGSTDTNPSLGHLGSDYQKWSHMLFQGTYPWISYNSTDVTIEDWQLDDAYGPIISAVVSGSEGEPGNWRIHVPESEQSTSGIAFILKGNGHIVTDTMFGAAGSTGYWDAHSSFCLDCLMNGPVVASGYNNYLAFGGTVGFTSVTNNGINNTIIGGAASSPYKGAQPSRPVEPQQASGPQPRMPGHVNSKVADFLFNNPLMPYPNQLDLYWFPDDIVISGAGGARIFPVDDNSSFSGKYFPLTGNSVSDYTIFNLNSSVGTVTIGTQIPAGPTDIIDTVRCIGAAYYVPQIYANTTLISSGAHYPCNSSGWTTNRIPIDLTAYAGQNLGFGWGVVGTEVDESWLAAMPQLSRDTNGNAATATAMKSNGTSGQVWAMTSGSTQGWVSPPTTQYPQVVATINDTSLTSSTGLSSNVNLYTTPSDGKIHNYQFCMYWVQTASGTTAGTGYGSVRYTNHGQGIGVRATETVSLTAQWNDTNNGSGGNQCPNFSADPNSLIQYSLILGSVTGTTPTIRYSGKLMDLGPVQ